MKCSLGISNFLEISSLSYSIFPSISLHWSLRKAFLSLLAILWNSAFKWVSRWRVKNIPLSIWNYMYSRCFRGLYISCVLEPSSISAPVMVILSMHLADFPSQVTTFYPQFFSEAHSTCWTILSHWKMGIRKNISQFPPFKGKILRNIPHCISEDPLEVWAPLASRYDYSAIACPLLVSHLFLLYHL